MLVLPLLSFLLFLAALIDVILCARDQVRHLPKVVWVLIVLLLPLVGSILWFTVGREHSARAPRRTRTGGSRRTGASSPGTVVVHEAAPRPASPGAPPSTEEQLAALEREITDDRIRELEAELRRRRTEPETP